MEFPSHSSFSYHGNSGEVGCYVASRPLTKDSNYFEVIMLWVGRAEGEMKGKSIKFQGVPFLDSYPGLLMFLLYYPLARKGAG